MGDDEEDSGAVLEGWGEEEIKGKQGKDEVAETYL